MKKDVKIFIVKAHAASGNDRTVYVIAPLDATFTDIFRIKNIPMLSIISTTVTAPMTLNEAAYYTIRDFAVLALNPNTTLFKSRFSVIAA